MFTVDIIRVGSGSSSNTTTGSLNSLSYCAILFNQAIQYYILQKTKPIPYVLVRPQNYNFYAVKEMRFLLKMQEALRMRFAAVSLFFLRY